MGRLTVVEITVATLGTKHEEAPYGRVRKDCSGAEPPDDRVTEQVDLAVVLYPEVLENYKLKHVQTKMRIYAHDATAKTGPCIGTRVVCVAVSEAGVGGPHDLLQLPELREEAGQLVVDLRRIRGHCVS